MQAEVSSINGHVEIRLQGRFTFDAHMAFTEAREKAIARNAQEIQVNLSGVEYMDSAGLGMLLILREKACRAGKSVALTDCRGPVGKAIKLANFDKLFDLAPAALAS